MEAFLEEGELLHFTSSGVGNELVLVSRAPWLPSQAPYLIFAVERLVLIKQYLLSAQSSLVLLLLGGLISQVEGTCNLRSESFLLNPTSCNRIFIDEVPESSNAALVRICDDQILAIKTPFKPREAISKLINLALLNSGLDRE